ncbi:hypothetical protein [Rubritalea sp.]|uniref:hypothetical protein n=1 Tax=Rubritalea sp. TaxID=2109375 RepID=UPI003EF9E8C4
MKITLIPPALLVSLATFSSAADITWSNAQSITGNTNEIITGRDLTIVNHNRAANAQLYKGTTTGSDIIASTYYTGAANKTQSNYTFTAADFKTTLASFDYDNHKGNTIEIYNDNTFTFRGLKVGQKYQVQFFYSDSRGKPRTITFDDGDGHTAAIASGEYITGSFTADSETLTITASGVENEEKTIGTNVNLSAIALTSDDGVTATSKPSGNSHSSARALLNIDGFTLILE